MALDPIWKLQLALVSYGNAYLSGQCQLETFHLHQTFDFHQIEWRDLHSQQLLAQHFTIWLEQLKRLQVSRISLHHASLLDQEKNPNPHVELLAISHFIVSHHAKQKFAWIFGQELAQWYTANENFQFPKNQQSPLRQMSYWRYELNSKLCKHISQDLNPPNWDEIQQYLNDEIFNQIRSLKLDPEVYIDDSTDLGLFDGLSKDTTPSDNRVRIKPLIPDQFHCPYIHQMLFRFDELNTAIQVSLKQVSNEETKSAQHLAQLRAFSLKLEEIQAKFIVKSANHYQTAKVTTIKAPSPLDPPMITDIKQSIPAAKNNKTSVLTLILITVALCVAAYYFGL